MSRSVIHLPGTFLFHRGLLLSAKAFGGAFGRIDPPEPATLAPTVGQVVADGFTLAWLRWEGPTGPAAASRPFFLLLHGLNSNAWGWARVAQGLRRHGTVVSVFLRGHGPGQAPAEGYSLDHTTRDLLAVLEALAADGLTGPCLLGGHSWGGKVACHLALTAPERFGALLLADPVPPQGLNLWLRTFPGLMHLAFRPERGPFPDRAALDAGALQLLFLQHGDELDRLLWTTGFEQQPDGSFRHRLTEQAFDEILHRTLAEDLVPRLTRLACPILLLRPTFTVGFWPGEWRPFRRQVPRLIERRVAGDHTFIHTNPRDTLAAMEQFLAAAGLLVDGRARRDPA